MSLEDALSEEQVLSEKIRSILSAKYRKVVDSQDQTGLVVFDDYKKPEQVMEILKEQGIDTTNLSVETKEEAETQEREGEMHDVFPGTTVRILINGRVLTEQFFPDPHLQYNA
jgi:hypothetical protein